MGYDVIIGMLTPDLCMQFLASLNNICWSSFTHEKTLIDILIGSLRRGRPKSLAISTPTKLLSLEEARAMVNTQGSPKQKFIEVGGGPSNLPDKYHTIIALPHK